MHSKVYLVSGIVLCILHIRFSISHCLNGYFPTLLNQSLHASRLLVSMDSLLTSLHASFTYLLSDTSIAEESNFAANSLNVAYVVMCTEQEVPLHSLAVA